MKIRVIVADDHRIVRDGLCSLLKKQPGIEVVGEAQDGWTAVRLTAKLLPDVVLMDIGMPDLNGMEATRHIMTDNPNVRVIALSMHSDKRFVTGMLKAGAAGYLLKECAFEELTEAIQTVVSGKMYLSPRISDMVLRDYMEHLSEEGSAFSFLTVREREVLQLLVEGKSAKEAADILHVSLKTVETHRQHLMEKLDIHSMADLTKLAIREGLTSLDI